MDDLESEMRVAPGPAGIAKRSTHGIHTRRFSGVVDGLAPPCAQFGLTAELVDQTQDFGVDRVEECPVALIDHGQHNRDFGLFVL